MAEKEKIIRCPVHGYIEIPQLICQLFVDTPIFQRLRSIEQTSMKPLYPSAHHSRFVHSLGVFHLARQTFRFLVKNTDKDLLNGVKLEEYKTAFEIAALMHDCAHSPFSHTFEDFYLQFGNGTEFLFEHVDNEFKENYANQAASGGEPKGHEIFSAAVFLKHYKSEYHELQESTHAGAGISPVLVARMITGITHEDVDSIRNQVENCLINLINGPAIDLDKLDYIMRDTWASGAKNVTIDDRRLVSSLRLAKRQQNLLYPVYNKSALSVIQNVIDGRNFLNYWVHKHHIAVYFQEILKESVEKTLECYAPEDDKDALKKAIFSEEAFSNPVAVNGLKFYLPTDGDLMSLVKNAVNDIPAISELLSRKPSRVPLWKTQAEYNVIFDGKNTSQKGKIFAQYKDLLKDDIEDANLLDQVLTVTVKPSIYYLRPEEVYVFLQGNATSFKTVASLTKQEAIEMGDNMFYYVYIPRELAHLKSKCIDSLMNAKVW